MRYTERMRALREDNDLTQKNQIKSLVFIFPYLSRIKKIFKISMPKY